MNPVLDVCLEMIRLLLLMAVVSTLLVSVVVLWSLFIAVFGPVVGTLLVQVFLILVVLVTLEVGP